MKITDLSTPVFGGGKSGGGTSKQIILLSVTTAPTGTFEKGSQYYNSSDKKIYTAVVADSWNDAKVEDPQFGVIYLFDNQGTTEYYQWDGDNLVETDLEKYQLVSNMSQDYEEDSETKYPSSKALSDGYIRKPTIVNNASSTGMALKGNTIYKWTAPISSLTIASAEVSDLETRLYFTTGSPITFADNSNLKWGGNGSAPSGLEANTRYCIAICNGLVEIDTYGSAS